MAKDTIKTLLFEFQEIKKLLHFTFPANIDPNGKLIQTVEKVEGFTTYEGIDVNDDPTWKERDVTPSSDDAC
jgi:hypothetical protein